MTNTPLILKEIPKDEAISFIRQYHYSKILPRLCKYFLGIFSEEKLLGVVELGWGYATPTNHTQTLSRQFPSNHRLFRNWKDVFSSRNESNQLFWQSSSFSSN